MYSHKLEVALMLLVAAVEGVREAAADDLTECPDHQLKKVNTRCSEAAHLLKAVAAEAEEIFYK